MPNRTLARVETNALAAFLGALFTAAMLVRAGEALAAHRQALHAELLALGAQAHLAEDEIGRQRSSQRHQFRTLQDVRKTQADLRDGVARVALTASPEVRDQLEALIGPVDVNPDYAEQIAPEEPAE